MTCNDTLTATRSDCMARSRDEGEEPLWRRMLSLVFTIALVAFVAYLWPANLGGSTRLVIVSGQSMEPTYELRDIVVVRDSEDTRVGDVVVFEVPEGEAEGMLVIHRVLELDDEGSFITQGDNRTTPDQWQLTEADIVGKPLAHIPQGGTVLGVIQNVWVIALICGLIALCVFWPDEDDELAEEDEEPVDAGSKNTTDDTDALDRDEQWATPDELAETWLDGVLANGIDAGIDDRVMVDAMAWLDEQLDDVENLVSRWPVACAVVPCGDDVRREPAGGSGCPTW